MKKLLVIIICCCSIYSAFCQNIGLRANAEFSDIKWINNSLGGGIYININEISKKIEIMFSFDFTKREKNFPDKNSSLKSGVISSFHKRTFAVSPLYVLLSKEKIKTKIGPLFNYNSINAGDNYYPINIVNSYKSQYIGVGLTGNIQFQEVFNLPINFDIFVSPIYLINIKNENDPTGVKSDYASNLKILNIQFGLSYTIK